jgi:hypothetical protein
MDKNEETLVVGGLINKHLVKINLTSNNILNTENSWGDFNKKVLLLSNNIGDFTTETSLLQKVISLTENYEMNDFRFVKLNKHIHFSLVEQIQFSGAEKIMLFGFLPAEASVFIDKISDFPFSLKNCEIVFFPSVDKCVTDMLYKKHFASIWLQLLKTSWIKK